MCSSTADFRRNMSLHIQVPLLKVDLEQQSNVTVGKLHVTSPKLTYKIVYPVLTYNVPSCLYFFPITIICHSNGGLCRLNAWRTCIIATMVEKCYFGGAINRLQAKSIKCFVCTSLRKHMLITQTIILIYISEYPSRQVQPVSLCGVGCTDKQKLHINKYSLSRCRLKRQNKA